MRRILAITDDPGHRRGVVHPLVIRLDAHTHHLDADCSLATGVETFSFDVDDACAKTVDLVSAPLAGSHCDTPNVVLRRHDAARLRSVGGTLSALQILPVSFGTACPRCGLGARRGKDGPPPTYGLGTSKNARRATDGVSIARRPPLAPLSAAAAITILDGRTGPQAPAPFGIFRHVTTPFGLRFPGEAGL